MINGTKGQVYCPSLYGINFWMHSLRALKTLDIQKTNTRIFHMLDIYKRGVLMVFELVDGHEKS